MICTRCGHEQNTHMSVDDVLICPTSVYSSPPPTDTEPPDTGTDSEFVTPSSFEYKGFFLIPANLDAGKTTAISKGMGLRRVNGKTRLFVAAPWHASPSVGEYEVPDGDLSTAPYALLVGTYPNIGGDKRVLTDNDGRPLMGGPAGTVYGLFWDEVDERLYWHYGSEYEAQYWHCANFGYSVISGGVATNIAAYRPAVNEKWGQKMTLGGMLPIPSAWAQANLGSADFRLALGFGGYFSVVTMGPASMGPALAAFNPSSLGAHLSHLPVKPIVGYPYSPGDPPGIPRCRRNANYTDVVPGQEDTFALTPRGRMGFWTWSDTIHNGGVWIDTPTHSGVIFFATLGHGKVFYQNSTLQTEEWRHYWIGYNTRKLADVAKGTKKPWEIQPDYVTEVPPPAVPYDGNNQRTYPFKPLVEGTTMAGSPDLVVQSGAAFDKETKRLYILINRIWEPGEGPERYPGVLVYQLK